MDNTQTAQDFQTTLDNFVTGATALMGSPFVCAVVMALVFGLFFMIRKSL